MAEEIEEFGGKSAADLGWEALWFVSHTLISALVVAVVVGAFAMAKPNPDSLQPKLICTAVILVAALVVGFGLAKVVRNQTARYVWLSGVLMFAIVCVYALDLPTGPGLCNGCGALEKLYRTFFNIANPSGLMGGHGFLIGTWFPLSMISYAVGAGLGLGKEETY